MDGAHIAHLGRHHRKVPTLGSECVCAVEGVWKVQVHRRCVCYGRWPRWAPKKVPRKVPPLGFASCHRLQLLWMVHHDGPCTVVRRDWPGAVCSYEDSHASLICSSCAHEGGNSCQGRATYE
eukprot:scaffold173888_cov21-Tisochrysis_lutea.AAC.1